MCKKIVINCGEVEIETPRQFLEHFGFEAPKETYYHSVVMDYCLCQVDCEKSLNDNDIPFKEYMGDIYVGMLENVIGD